MLMNIYQLKCHLCLILDILFPLLKKIIIIMFLVVEYMVKIMKVY